MRLHRRTVIGSLMGALAAPVLLGRGLAQGAEVTLRMHHFLPPSSGAHSRFLKPWADKVMAEGGGRIRIEIFHSMQLGGTPPQLYDQARDGVVDLVWTLPGYAPNRFPKIEAFELPFVASKRAAATAPALWEYSQMHLGDELREVHPIAVWACDHGLIHSTKPVRTVSDMKGLKLRFATRLNGEAVRALGGSAIGMPAPQISESLSQGVINGAVLPWEVIPALKMHELVHNHSEFPGSPTFYSCTFVLAMNKDRYAGLPAFARDVIDDNSGLPAAIMAGRGWDSAEAPVSEMVRRNGNAIISISEEETARFRTGTQPVIDNWLNQMRDRGIDGGRLLEDARALVAKHADAS